MSLSVPDVPQLSQDSTKAPGPSSVQASLTDAAGDEPPPPLPANNSVSPGMPPEPPAFESVPQPVSVPSPVPLPVPPFVNGCRNSQPRSLLKPSQDLDGDIIGDDLDKLLDQAEPESAMVSGPLQGACDAFLFWRIKVKRAYLCVIRPVTFVSGYTHGEGASPTANQYCLGRFHAKFLPDAISHRPFPPQRSAAVHRNAAPTLPQIRLHWLLWYGQI